MQLVDSPSRPSFRSRELRGWLRGHGARPETLRPLPGDVSPRRYARVSLDDTAGLTPVDRSAILALYPATSREACQRFEATTRVLLAASIPVPALLATDCSRGWMLLADAGARTLYDWAHDELATSSPRSESQPAHILTAEAWVTLEPFFDRAVDMAGAISRLDPSIVGELNPILDGEILLRELRQTWEVFLEPEGMVGDPALAEKLWTMLRRLVTELARPRPTPCHRDFMARNLVPLREGSEPGALILLDHQDLRLGPPHYDLASLLNDSLFPPPQLAARLLRRTLPGEADPLLYHRAAAQRTLKAVGTYASFARRGVERHLPLIPPTLGRALHHLERLPEAAPLVPALSELWRGRFC